MNIEKFFTYALIGNKQVLIYAYTGFISIKSVNDFKKLAVSNFVLAGKEYNIVNNEVKPC